MRRMTSLARTRAPERTLERILVGLEPELAAATDEEIIEAARDLGMNLSMQGSAAFIGLKYPSQFALRRFFEDLFASVPSGADDLPTVAGKIGPPSVAGSPPALDEPPADVEHDD